MIDWLRGMDVAIFRWINLSLANGFFDWLMPRASDPPYGVAIGVAICAILICRGGARGRVFVVMLLLSVCVGNWLIVETLKNGIGRLRPFNDVLDARVLVGRSGSFSMPSSHSANWFSAAFIAFVYYRRSIYWMLPAAALVGFSRIYNGVHYPSDVVAGAVIGAGYSAGIVWGLDVIWQWAGPRWFAGWHGRLPSLLDPRLRAAEPVGENEQAQWVRLGYVLAGFLFLLRLAYLASGTMELSEDEAYQWIWSKHLDISYYSKPLLIAYTQWLGTHLWGDNQFGVRFFSPVISLIISILLLKFMARIMSGRAAFALFLVCCATPLLAIGSVLMTIDPLSVMFWTAAMTVGWDAAQPEGTTRDWLWVGLWIGLGFLSKYTNLIQLVCWIVFFLLWAPARKHLRRPGPWLALGIVVLSLLPVIIWNAQRDWVTVRHVAADGQLDKGWTRIYTGEFMLLEGGLLHPLFFAGALWASVAFWRRGRRDPALLYLFSMGMPLFLIFFLLSWHSRVIPNWIAPAITPMFCLMVIYWGGKWEQTKKWLRPAFGIGVGIGVAAVVLAHGPQLIDKILHHSLPPNLDPLRRVEGWKETAAVIGAEKDKLEAEGKPTIMIGEHYGITGEVTFYLPEAKQRVTSDPNVFFYATTNAQNQFYFWPNYLDKKGDNAILFRESGVPKLKPGWFGKWWQHEDDLFVAEKPPLDPPPSEIMAQFESVTNLGLRDVLYKGKVVRRVEVYACRNLR